jgi:hypothetical protein
VKQEAFLPDDYNEDAAISCTLVESKIGGGGEVSPGGGLDDVVWLSALVA